MHDRFLSQFHENRFKDKLIFKNLIDLKNRYHFKQTLLKNYKNLFCAFFVLIQFEVFFFKSIRIGVVEFYYINLNKKKLKLHHITYYYFEFIKDPDSCSWYFYNFSYFTTNFAWKIWKNKINQLWRILIIQKNTC